MKTEVRTLTGLRGIAAVWVALYHIHWQAVAEGKAPLPLHHGYLAVDFFFLLSGFVVSYAYDDRWGKMTQWEFYKRRLIRLQPMVIAGSVIGAIFFYLQRSPPFH